MYANCMMEYQRIIDSLHMFPCRNAFSSTVETKRISIQNARDLVQCFAFFSSCFDRISNEIALKARFDMSIEHNNDQIQTIKLYL